MTSFGSFILLDFYLRTNSSLESKIKVVKWFILRTFWRIFSKDYRNQIKKIESQIIKSRLKDGSIYYHHIEQIIHLYEAYGRKRDEIFKYTLPNNAVILDVGAHIGTWAIKKAIQYPSASIICFEPEKYNFELLEKNKRENKVRLSLVKKALYNKKGKMKLFLAEFASGMHTFKPMEKKKKNICEEVAVDTIDNFLARLKVKKMDLIKIDTEGSEYPILQGARKTLKKMKPMLSIELHSKNDPHTEKDILSFLSKMKYSTHLSESKAELFAKGETK